MSDLKNDKLDALIMLSAHVLAEKNISEFDAVDISNIEIPKALDKKINRIINREWRRQEYGFVSAFARRAAAVILVLCTTAFVFAMSIEAVRESFWNAVFDWYDEYFSVQFVPDSANEAPPSFIEEKREPTVPDEWEKEVLLDNEFTYYVLYLHDGEETILYSQNILDNAGSNYDNEATVIEKTTVNGHEGYWLDLTDKGTLILIWQDGLYSYRIVRENADIEREFIMELAESIE